MKLKLILKTKKAKIIACILVGILPAILMIIGILNVKTELYYYFNPLKRPLYGFEIYKPTKLPNDLVVYEERVAAWKNDFLLWGAQRPGYVLRFDSNPDMNNIAETSLYPAEAQQLGIGCGANPDASKCQIRQTPNGIEYKFETEYSTLGDRAAMASIVYVQKENTIIRVTNNYQYSRKWTDQEWDDLIDSLEVVSPDGISFEYYTLP